MNFTKENIDIFLEASSDYDVSMILDYKLLEKFEPTRMYAEFTKFS